MKGPIHGPFDHRFNIKSLMRTRSVSPDLLSRPLHNFH